MEGSLYYIDDEYHLINTVGEAYSVALEFKTFKNKIILNENLKLRGILFELNQENLKNMLSPIKEFENITYDSFDLNGYIIYNSQIIKIQNWRNVFNFIACRF